MSRAAVFTFQARLPRFAHPYRVVDGLQRLVAAPAGLGILGIWQRPFDPTRWSEYINGQTLFPHPSVPSAFWTEYFELVQKNGLTATQKMAWQNPGRPFTITEAMSSIGATQGDRWVFDLFHRHDIRDGFYCPVGQWIVAYSSPVVLHRKQFTPAVRGHLFYAAIQAAFHIEDLMPASRLPRGPVLSQRERSVLAELSSGERLQQIVERTSLNERTVREYIRRANAKLGARTSTQAVAIAIRAMLI